MSRACRVSGFFFFPVHKTLFMFRKKKKKLYGMKDQTVFFFFYSETETKFAPLNKSWINIVFAVLSLSLLIDVQLNQCHS